MQHDFLIAVVEDCCADNVIAHEQAINLYEFIVQHTRVGLLPEHRQQWLTDLAKMDRFREGLTSAAIVGPS